MSYSPIELPPKRLRQYKWMSEPLVDTSFAANFNLAGQQWKPDFCNAKDGRLERHRNIRRLTGCQPGDLFIAPVAAASEKEPS